MSAASPPFSVIIAACNEEDYIATCLQALLAQDAAAGLLEVVVAANGCTDMTVAIVHRMAPRFAARGWRLICLPNAVPGKVRALNHGDAAATGALRAYLDADVVCDAALFGQLRAALAGPLPGFATGRLVLAQARSGATRRYGAVWVQLPFVRDGACGAGLFATNATGRARWKEFPPVISDDTFVRLHFTPAERQEVPACYRWPMPEGFRALVRVRRRQNAGVAEIRRLYPSLVRNEGKAGLTLPELLRVCLRMPLAALVYLGVHIAVRGRPAGDEWTRGR